MKQELKNNKLSQNAVTEWELVLFNDTTNSFEHVIGALMKCCNHGIYQAEQCATIAHYKGRCSIKRGDYKSLLDISFDLKSHDLKTEII